MVLIFILAFGVSPQWTWLLFPLIVVVLFVFATAVSLLLSSLYVRFRDTAIIWSVVASALFYATPVLYPIEIVPSTYRGPDPAQSAHPALRAGAPMGHRSGRARRGQRRRRLDAPARAGRDLRRRSACSGVWYFNREAPRIAEEL